MFSAPENPAAKVIIAVYEPPQPGLPHLGVIIDESGKVSAVGFETAEEAVPMQSIRPKRLWRPLPKARVPKCPPDPKDRSAPPT